MYEEKMKSSESFSDKNTHLISREIEQKLTNVVIVVFLEKISGEVHAILETWRPLVHEGLFYS